MTWKGTPNGPVGCACLRGPGFQSVLSARPGWKPGPRKPKPDSANLLVSGSRLAAEAAFEFAEAALLVPQDRDDGQTEEPDGKQCEGGISGIDQGGRDQRHD